MTLRLLFTCGRELNYPRNQYLLNAFEKSFTVRSVTESRHSYFARIIHLMPALYMRRHDLDALFIGFYGHPLVLFARRLTNRPIFFDPYISTYDTLCFDRRVYRPGSLVGRLAFWLDRQSSMDADHLLMDTNANVEYYERMFGVPRRKMFVAYAGCDEAVFTPHPEIEPDSQTVLFFGSYLPLQGVDVIVRAAARLKDQPNLRFCILGSGYGEQTIKRLAEQLETSNIDFLPFIPYEELPKLIARSMLCLGGHFGDRDKARRVIAGKTYQCLAMSKPTLVGDNPANRELMTHGQDSWMVKMNDPVELAESIKFLAANKKLRDDLGNNARTTFLNRASLATVSEQLRDWVNERIAQGR